MYIPRTLRRLKDRLDHRGGIHGALFEPYRGDEVVSLDCETTSLNVAEAEILSIAAVRIRGTRVLTSERLDIRLKPPASLGADSIKIHKLRAADLADGIEIDEALRLVLEFVGNRPILGYYVSFDVRMLDKYLRPRYGFGLPNKTIELSHVYHDIIKWKSIGGTLDLRFDTLASKLDVPVIERHTALGDAITVALMYVRLKHGEAPSAGD